MTTVHTVTYEKSIKCSDFFRYDFQERIWTESFHAETCGKINFHLKIFPAGEDDKGYTSLFLYCKPQKPLNVHYNLFVKDFKGNKYNSEWTTEFNEEHKAWGKRKMSPYPRRSNVDDDAEFIFGVTLDFVLPAEFEEQKEEEEEKKVVPKTMKERMIAAFEDGTHCDVVFKVEDETIKAHQSIVGIRSSMFAAIFEKQQAFEKRPFIVDIISFDAETVKRAIRFCYTDKLEEMAVEKLFKIYDFAMVYQIEDLDTYAYDAIIGHLNAENASKISNFAEEIDDSHLRQLANNFIAKNLKQVRSFEESFANLSFDNCKEILRLI